MKREPPDTQYCVYIILELKELQCIIMVCAVLKVEARDTLVVEPKMAVMAKTRDDK